MTDLNSQVMVPDDDVEEVQQREWGHPNRRKRGERHWGIPPIEFKIALDSVEMIAFGQEARVENLGTSQNPRLKFFIPEGRPGKDFQPDRGYTGEHLGMEFKNGAMKTPDYSVRVVRSIIATGVGIQVKSEFTEAGAVSIEINAEPMIDEIVSRIALQFDERLSNLEKAVSFDEFKKAIESYAADYRAKMTEMSEMKLAFNLLQSEYERLKIAFNNHVGV